LQSGVIEETEPQKNYYIALPNHFQNSFLRFEFPAISTVGYSLFVTKMLSGGTDLNIGHSTHFQLFNDPAVTIRIQFN
jgi:hypothetical protein